MHDWLGPLTGAEHVLDHILRCYPGADVFTTLDFLPAQHRHVLHGARVRTSFVQRLPFARRGYWNYVPLMPHAVGRFDLRGYDLVISNSHAFAKGARTGPGQAHVCYLQTPMRFAWDLEAYYLRQFRLSGPRGWAARAVFRRMRSWDVRTAEGVNAFLAVSGFVADRCRRYYAREAEVLYPPVNVDFYTPGGPRADYYLAASRLTPFKRLDLVIEAFRQMPGRRLVVIGDGPERQRLQARCTPNITMLGYQPDEVLRGCMREARAFLFAAPEDFGIVMAEAQACGTPVIALGAGGAREIVRAAPSPQPTGLLFDEDTVPALCDAVDRFEREGHLISAEHCRDNAGRFHPLRFQEGLRAAVSRVLETGSMAR